MYSEAVPQHYCFDIMEKWIRLPIMKPGAEAGFVRELRAPPALTPPDVLEDVSEELAAYDAEDVHSETEALFGSSFEEEVLKDEEEAHSHGH
ncbi:6746_t:CDS:2 [Cetraspora pellucida]|uniref:6746_t:CDS:1 n=1 Tax=Cetraspora pellucida TaxID=1433469 RepID=A0A9N8ZFG1_9GLOM|nr:6746_t:CDS:2 [Cetraspora pellucida]